MINEPYSQSPPSILFSHAILIIFRPGQSFWFTLRRVSIHYSWLLVSSALIRTPQARTVYAVFLICAVSVIPQSQPVVCSSVFRAVLLMSVTWQSPLVSYRTATVSPVANFSSLVWMLSSTCQVLLRFIICLYSSLSMVTISSRSLRLSAFYWRLICTIASQAGCPLTIQLHVF